MKKIEQPLHNSSLKCATVSSQLAPARSVDDRGMPAPTTKLVPARSVDDRDNHQSTDARLDTLRDMLIARRDDNAMLLIAEIARGPGWLPIDTAPKDGTHILILVQEGPSLLGRIRGTSEMKVVRWRLDRGHWTTDSWDDGDYDVEMRPTHWMPLPSLPDPVIEPMYCMDCGAEQPHHCQGVPGGFGEET